jgi:hypothetical protein
LQPDVLHRLHCPPVPGDRDQIKLKQLEQRRVNNDRAMWLAPVITMAAQAFLLQVISDPKVGFGGRFAVLTAGIAATLAAIWTIVRGRSREVLYSEAIQEQAVALGLDDVRPAALKRPPRLGGLSWQSLDRRLALAADSGRWPIAYMVWTIALLCFIVADLAMFFSV